MSMNVPSVPSANGPSNVVPSGFRIVTSVPPPGDEPIETLDRSRLTFWLRRPVNEYRMFWPGTLLRHDGGRAGGQDRAGGVGRDRVQVHGHRAGVHALRVDLDGVGGPAVSAAT